MAFKIYIITNYNICLPRRFEVFYWKDCTEKNFPNKHIPFHFILFRGFDQDRKNVKEILNELKVSNHTLNVN